MNIVSALEHSFNYAPCGSGMIIHVAGLVSLETVVRRILICVNIVSSSEHSYNYTPCGSGTLLHVAGLVSLDTVERHIPICVNIVSGLEPSFNYTSCGNGMLLHVAGLVSLKTVVRHILICVNIVSGLEHSYNFTPYGRSGIFGELVRRILICEYSKLIRATMWLFVVDLVYLQTAQRHPYICVNKVSCLEHYMWQCDGIPNRQVWYIWRQW